MNIFRDGGYYLLHMTRVLFAIKQHLYHDIAPFFINLYSKFGINTSETFFLNNEF